jgi:hypothetical protein
LSILSNDLLARQRRNEHIQFVTNAGFNKEDSAMRDDFLSGDWAANKHRLTTDVDKLSNTIATKVSDSFEALNRAQFDAPWRRVWRKVRISGLR